MTKASTTAPASPPTLRVLLRRSTDDSQEFSLDVQREGCRSFAAALLTRTPPVAWKASDEYVDDGVAGDDFLARAGLHRLMKDVQPGDVVVCRDHSRLGRDAVEVTLVIREIVKNRQARLFYYSSGQEVAFNTAIDAATIMIQGVGAQMELEAIRSRTREALRSRARQGRVAGGRCYGYDLVRQPDASGRMSTAAVINPHEAAVIREIFQRYLEGHGLRRIADELNNRSVQAPAGRRGYWTTDALRQILRRERYRGVYVHGLIQRVRRGGKRVAIAGDPSKVLRTVVPEWRIIDEDTFEAVQKVIVERADEAREKGGNPLPGPCARYAITGLAKCAACGESIGVHNTTLGGKHVKAYACGNHRKRGALGCAVSHAQPIEDVDGPLAAHIVETVLDPKLVDQFVADVVEEVERRQAAPRPNADKLTSELTRLRAEQKKLAAAVASAPDVPELVAELRRRLERIRAVETELASVKRAPRVAAEVKARLQEASRRKAGELRELLSAQRNARTMRDTLRALFPDGIWLEVVNRDGYRTWAVRGKASLEVLTLAADPVVSAFAQGGHRAHARDLA